MTWRILIVGAGIAGLGAARALRPRGLAVDVVEQVPQWTQVGTGVYLPGNAARALRGLGLESAVAEHGAVIARQRFCDHRGRLLSEIDVATCGATSVPAWRFGTQREDRRSAPQQHLQQDGRYDPDRRRRIRIPTPTRLT